MFKIHLKEGTCDWKQFGEISPKLGMIVYYVMGRLVDFGIQEATITSLIRPKDKDCGIHACMRAADIRIDFPMDIAKKIEQEVNLLYPYDINRPLYKTIIMHSSDDYNDNGIHLHIQVHKFGIKGNK